MDKTEAATILRPGTAWNQRGDVLEQADDDSPRVSIPTEKELQVEMDKVDYIGKRIKEYPPVTELADAFYHNEKGNSGPLETYIAKVQAIKEKYPKPA